ncbi:MAG: GTP-binding protein [Candidatus Omnitrophica bacterium]|nr:GTP-binding protein [Candidatus Omnitrophota bacterium]
MVIEREGMNVVIVGHVDHGKSTLVGRLLADTGSLPDGKLEAVQQQCKQNAKPFEYAFLLDALKDEQAQGITIDTARSFFKSSKRDYIIIDAPGHIEFLKNMISGAARAEAALLLIDAHEGIKENSKRHGYMMRFLGIKNIAVLVNKMDLVGYDQKVFEKIKTDYSQFLAEIDLVPKSFIPIAAFHGDNMISGSKNMPWHKGGTVLDVLDSFKKEAPLDQLPFRMPVQDIYKFTEDGDERRIVAGRVECGSIKVGDDIVFLPSGKKNRIKSVEYFNGPARREAFAQESIGFTYDTEIYIRPGEILCKSSEKLPHVTNKFRANIFWMGKQPLIKDKTYKLKILTQQVPVIVSDIVQVLDASDLASSREPHVDRYEVGEIIFETLKPIAFDVVVDSAPTGRFVLVDNYEIAGGGIILAPIFDTDSNLKTHIQKRDYNWERSQITPQLRAHKYQHKSALIVIAGKIDTGKQRIAKALEEALFNLGKNVYFLGVSNRLVLATQDSKDKVLSKYDALIHLGELAHLMTDAGLILITSITDIDHYELAMIKKLNNPNRTLVVCVGEDSRFNPESVDLMLVENEESDAAVNKIVDLLLNAVVLVSEYEI